MLTHELPITCGAAAMMGKGDEDEGNPFVQDPTADPLAAAAAPPTTTTAPTQPPSDDPPNYHQVRREWMARCSTEGGEEGLHSPLPPTTQSGEAELDVGHEMAPENKL